MRKGRELFIGTSIGVIIGFLLFVFALGPVESPGEISTFHEEAIYKATVCPTITRADGTVEKIECTHNLLTYAGMNATRNLLGAGVGAAFDYIGLECGENVPNVVNTSLDSECTDDLVRAQGTFSINAAGGGTDVDQGNWSIAHTFTSDITDEVFGAGLFNASSSDTMLAVANFSTSASLENLDQLTVNWTLQVS